MRHKYVRVVLQADIVTIIFETDIYATPDLGGLSEPGKALLSPLHPFGASGTISP